MINMLTQEELKSVVNLYNTCCKPRIKTYKGLPIIFSYSYYKDFLLYNY